MKNGFEYGVIKCKIQQKIKQGKTKYIIYPNGYLGEEVKKILKELNVNVEFYIDNKNYDGIDILNIQQAADKGIEDCIILIASNNDNYYKEIRENIYKVFPKDLVLDLYPNYELTEEAVDNCVFDLSEYLNEVRNKC